MKICNQIYTPSSAGANFQPLHSRQRGNGNATLRSGRTRVSSGRDREMETACEQKAGSGGFIPMARTTRSAAKRQRVAVVESALANVDVVSQLAAFLDAADLCQVKATCKALGSSNDDASVNGLSVTEEATRRIYEGASDEEKAMLPRHNNCWCDPTTSRVGEEGIGLVDEDCTTLGMLLDLDDGTLSVYQNGRRLGALKDELAGEYCWTAGFCGEGDVSIRRGYEITQVALADPDQLRHRLLHAQVLRLIPVWSRCAGRVTPVACPRAAHRAQRPGADL
ncbi:hypothetical protein THAOC_25601 [Thalassiosira oceanica]|uniref:SPRY domain-containing protein n=1 Tax=Thalassiosira oceanica TaxID=159749 RepID=K0S121_THAOC|nr:hypothetical protein THAOC_25601 [Thalassiosira oceanica]|eukprot:EJK54746.1 hypothetical protein THAOC_25601 [Thalassiosira oceanica]